MAEIILVDDDIAIRDMLCDVLSLQGHSIRQAGDAEALERQLAAGPADLVVLDIGLPGKDGLSIARELRARHDLGIIMLTGAAETVDRIVGLEVGADDYVTKPFSVNELAARVDAVVRRRRFSGKAMLPFGPFFVDLSGWRLMNAAGEDVRLFATEIDLVAAFASHPGRLLSRDDLLRLAPAHGADPVDRSIDTRIARLRRKLEGLGLDADLIETMRGGGYIYKGATG
ncbi:response regulator transcription factor [Ensifer soli]|uniref:response regulator transcription factor n=1 Tax=Ciceribacter sp. sgz301302 TaxID=3342379 RepID=UPI0035B8DDA8